MKSDKERIHRWITQADLERMLGDAYKRGAEAMREAAALAVHDTHTTGLLSPAAVTAAVRVIRALPVPEDKP